MAEKNYFDLFKIKVNESLISNPTPEYEDEINKAFQMMENKWKQLKLKNLGQLSDDAAENLKKLKENEFDFLKDPKERKKYYLKMKEEKEIELKEKLIDSNEDEVEIEAIKQKYHQYFSESEIKKIVREVFKAKTASNEILSIDTLDKIANYASEMERLGETSLFTAFEFDEKASYETVENRIKKKLEKLQKEYDKHPNDSTYKKYINIKDILKKFEKEVFKTDEFKSNYEKYKCILQYSMFIQLLLKVKDKDIKPLYFNDILLKKAEEANINKESFILFLLKVHKYFGIKGIAPVTDYYIEHVDHRDMGDNDIRQALQQLSSVEDYEYYLGREELKLEKLDLAYGHFKEANNIDPRYALYELAELYYTGTKQLPPDLQKSYALHNEAIKYNNISMLNNRNSLYRISQMRFKGEGCKKDDDLGFRYLQKFVKSNNHLTMNDYFEQAQLDLAECYYKGKGTLKDYRSALYHYRNVDNAIAKKNIKKIERELSYKPIIIIGLYLVSYIILLLLSLHYMEKVFTSTLNQTSVLTYFSILIVWIVYSGLLLRIKHSWINQLIGLNGTTVRMKMIQFITTNKKWILSIAVILFGGVCFYSFYTKGIIKPWLTEADYAEMPEFISLLFDYGVNWVTAGIVLTVLFPLVNIKKTDMYELSIFDGIDVNFKSVFFGILNTCILVFGLYYAVQWSAVNVLTDFSVLKYIGITIFVTIIVLPFRNSSIINDILNEKTSIYTLAAILLYGALTCAIVAENYGDLPIATTIVQVVIASFYTLLMDE